MVRLSRVRRCEACAGASRSRRSYVSCSRRFSPKVRVPNHASANRSAAAWLQLAGAARANDNARARALGGLFDSPPRSLAKNSASVVAPRRLCLHRRVPRLSGHYCGVRLCRVSGDGYRANELRDRTQCPGGVRSVRNVCRPAGSRTRTNRQTMVVGASTPAAARRTIPRAGLGRPAGALLASRSSALPFVGGEFSRRR
jgi:hypothetical protein